ncbi:MAG TPA: hypothetical protein VMM56_05130 [Planctomycetaceae bacterium]|nr:hypothetical protein [Planctomycetaceae bacterium]
MPLRPFLLCATILLVVTATAFAQEKKQADEGQTLEEKLDQKLAVNFNRTPLKEAIAELSKQSKITIVIDGEGLKFPGLTQNMPLSLSLNDVTVREALQSILEGKGNRVLGGNPQTLVFTYDEKTQELRLSSRAQTEQKKMKIYELKPNVLSLEKKLQQKIDINFRKTALQDAFAYISGESKIPIVLDGDALKSAGFTLNLNQDMILGVVTAQEALQGLLQGKGHRIIQDNPDTLILIYNENTDGFTVSTVPYATERGFKPYEFKPD